MAYKGIEEYGLIGNSYTVALVGLDGSIDWCCLPRFDSPSVFAAILDDEIGGSFQIKPQIPFRSNQAYLPDTNILQTTFQTDTGTAVITDFMPCYRTSRGKLVYFHEIHRLVECISGKVTLELILEPRPDYARANTAMKTSKHGVTVSTTNRLPESSRCKREKVTALSSATASISPGHPVHTGHRISLSVHQRTGRRWLTTAFSPAPGGTI
jgi:GH15 family glucan-1,4-alpha-glucosidase